MKWGSNNAKKYLCNRKPPPKKLRLIPNVKPQLPFLNKKKPSPSAPTKPAKKFTKGDEYDSDLDGFIARSSDEDDNDTGKRPQKKSKDNFKKFFGDSNSDDDEDDEDEYEEEEREARTDDEDVEKASQMAFDAEEGAEPKTPTKKSTDDDDNTDIDEDVVEVKQTPSSSKTPEKKLRIIKEDAKAKARREKAKAFNLLRTENRKGEELDEQTEKRIVNPGQQGAEPILLPARLANLLKPHQLEGIQFCWANIVVPADDDLKGCVLAHCMLDTIY